MIANKDNLIRDMQEDLFRKNGQGWYRVVSGSMRPLIDVDDRICAKPVSAAEIKRGDIILFNTTEAVVSHRVIKMIRQNGRTRILQKGDATPFSSTIFPESIIGRVTAIEKHGRVLTLDRGGIRVLNIFLGLKNCLLYRFNEKMSSVKGWFRKKPGYRYLRGVYRIFKTPFAVLNQKKMV